MKFVDLFAGLGGFHKALSSLGHECVFASEINAGLANLYEKNWNLLPFGDIRRLTRTGEWDIPDHDILCAGFPCQPFSKAGKQGGLKDETRGTLLEDIVAVLKKKKPRFFILENVPFIAKHDNEATWAYMKRALEGGDGDQKMYEVEHDVFSPHEFGIPQHRFRIFIVGGLIEKGGLSRFSFSEIHEQKAAELSYDIADYIGPSSMAKKLADENLKCLQLWQNIIDKVPLKDKIPGFPIWGMEFGATYPYLDKVPRDLSAKELGKYRGNFGIPLEGKTKEEQLANLPSYSRSAGPFPKWKAKWITRNREFYQKYNNRGIHKYVEEISKFQSQSWQKLEWNVGDGSRNIFDYLIQFRPSGIRVKKVDYFPSLVCVSTQIPIVGWEKRYLTKQEASRLQGLDGILLPEFDNAAFSALGNAVNVQIVSLIAKHLVGVSPVFFAQNELNRHV